MPENAIEDNNWLLTLLQEKSKDSHEVKLLRQRETKCEKIKAAQVFMKSQCPPHIIQDQERRLKYRNNFLFKIKQPNENMPSAENFVQGLISEERGRHLVVTRDVPPGT